MLNSIFDLYFDVVHATTNNRYVDGKDIKLIFLVHISIFNDYILTSSSGKHLEDISHAPIASLIYKLITNAKGSDDLLGGFDRGRNRRPRELTNSKTIKGKYHVRIMLKVIFGFAEHQETATYGLG